MKVSPTLETNGEQSIPVIKKEPGDESPSDNVNCTAPNHWSTSGNYFNHAADYHAVVAATCGSSHTIEGQHFFKDPVHASSSLQPSLATSPHNMVQSFNQPAIMASVVDTSPRFMSRRGKPRLTMTTKGRRSWGDEEKRRTELIIELRSKEWKARQAMWKSGIPTGYHHEYNAGAAAQFVAQRNTTDVLPYSYDPAHPYTMVSEGMQCCGAPRRFDALAQPEMTVNPVVVRPQLKSTRKLTCTEMTNGEGEQPVIKNVVSLANGKESDNEIPEPVCVRRRAKRPRASFGKSCEDLALFDNTKFLF